jgi:hypothetical protein
MTALASAVSELCNAALVAGAERMCIDCRCEKKFVSLCGISCRYLGLDEVLKMFVSLSHCMYFLMIFYSFVIPQFEHLIVDFSAIHF